MDINLFRVITTVAGFVCFGLIMFWAWGKAAKPGFEQAAMQPIEDDDLPHPAEEQHKDFTP